MQFLEWMNILQGVRSVRLCMLALTEFFFHENIRIYKYAPFLLGEKRVERFRDCTRVDYDRTLYCPLPPTRRPMKNFVFFENSTVLV